MFKIVREGVRNGNGRNGHRKLGDHPSENTIGVCQECNATIVFEGPAKNKAGEIMVSPAFLREIFEKKVIKQGKRFAGYGWMADCPDCGSERTVFFMCVTTTLANNQINVDNVRIID